MVFALLPTDFLVEWRGFGTDEDDQYLASLHFQARGDSLYPSSPYYTGPSHLDYTSFGPESTDFQDMRADDAIFDSYNMDFSQLHWELPSHPSAPSVPSQPEKGRSWRDVVGTEFAHPPIPPPPTPAREEPEEEVTPKPKDKKKEVCRYWLNVGLMRGFEDRATACMAIVAGTRTRMSRRRSPHSWSTRQNAASARRMSSRRTSDSG